MPHTLPRTRVPGLSSAFPWIKYYTTTRGTIPHRPYRLSTSAQTVSPARLGSPRLQVVERHHSVPMGRFLLVVAPGISLRLHPKEPGIVETLYGADLPAYKIKHHSGWGMWLHDPPAGISPGARQTNLVFGQRQKNTLGRREFRDENILLDRCIGHRILISPQATVPGSGDKGVIRAWAL